ncbi:autoinducer binding domain-containing protein [Burkholderia gladioli]|uniref:autoinducer binding domain-containing protein n=1 Tax=Burkholderia gladioli TaxID=28095 RepID=UPI001640463D|nr:autoinducer binding domain-containing protein [Burkholderia gladioli]
MSVFSRPGKTDGRPGLPTPSDGVLCAQTHAGAFGLRAGVLSIAAPALSHEASEYDCFALFDELECAPHREALREIVSRLVRLLGAERFAFLLVPAEGEPPRLGDEEVLTDAAPAWLDSYRARGWFETDPGIAYARRNSAPTGAAAIAPRADGPCALGEHDAAHGFRAKLIAPAHLPTPGLGGVLYVGLDARADEGEAALHGKRILYRLIASELLDWHARQQRSDAARSLALTERETGILRLLRSGCTAHDIAGQLCVAVPTVYGYYKRLNEKFSVNHISLTVKRAATLGLLDM